MLLFAGRKPSAAPLGDEGWIKRLEREHGRTLALLKRTKAKEANDVPGR